MAWFAAAGVAGGTLLSAYGQYRAGQEKEKYYKKSADIAREDAATKIAATRMRADMLLERGAYAIRKEREEGRKLTATQRALYSKAGVKLVGTPTEVISQTVRNIEDVVAQTRFDVEADANLILLEGTSEANRLLAISSQLKDQAKWAEDAGYINATSTLLTGGATAYAAY